MKVTAYIIVAEVDLKTLEAMVNHHIAEGWHPIGGPFKVGTDWGIAQAMIK